MAKKQNKSEEEGERMSTIDQVFESLFFGSGSWLGLILLIMLLTALTVVRKEIGVLTIPISVFLAIEYLSYDLGWHTISMLLYTTFTIIYLVKDYLK
jgi:hypothetical protein